MRNDRPLSTGEWWRWRLVPLLAWIGMILWMASRPKAAFFLPDKDLIFGIPRQFAQYGYHVGVFFVLAILFQRCLPPFRAWTIVRGIELRSLVGSVFVSICSEVIQFYVPTRTPTVRDLALDLFGTVLALGLARRIQLA